MLFFKKKERKKNTAKPYPTYKSSQDMIIYLQENLIDVD